MSIYSYNKEYVNITTLSYQIEQSTVISGALLFIDFNEPNNLEINFDRVLYINEETTLSGIVSNHGGNKLSIDNLYDYTGDIKEYLNEDAVVVDTYTNISGAFIPMQVLVNRRDLYNDIENPLYLEDHIPLLGENGSIVTIQNDVSSVLNAISSNGWYTQYIKNWTYPSPMDLLIYYGWLNSFNYSENSWNNEKVSHDMAKYNYIILGDGIQNYGHADYSNAQIIIPRIKILNQHTNIFGYVSTAQDIDDFKTKVDEWDTLQVDGIFMDESGYDYGTTRSGLNECIDYIHGKTYANLCFVNAWNLDHILGVTNDESYPNSTYNPTTVDSNLTTNDWCLLESFPINTASYTTTGGYESKSDWATRGSSADSKRNNYGINIAAVGIINNDNSNGQDLFNFGFVSSMMWNLDAFGTSDTSYGSSSATVKYWSRPKTEGLGREWAISPSVQNDLTDTDKYHRYVDFGRFSLDFSSSEQASDIERFTPNDSFILRFNTGDLTEGLTTSPSRTTASGLPLTGLVFSDSTEESMFDAFEIPDKWKDGTDIDITIHFFNDYSQTGIKVCRWCLDYQIYSELDELSNKTTTTIYDNHSLPNNVNEDTYMKSELVMSYNDSNNPLARGKMLSFRIYRDCTNENDTMEEGSILVLITFKFAMEDI